ncbi:MAG: 50S ribosomal protein L17 [Cyclobacteriaceae bacterium]|nr:50S ribosomal protein L17 [Cyclobacteriaceae bacterium]
MRHGKKINHLGRTAPHRKAMLSNMASSLIENKRITTTLAKAKALRKYVEPLLTKAKNNTTHSRRVVFSYLQNKETVQMLFDDIATKIADRPGGYTRIIKMGNRLGDNAEMCLIELVDYNELLLKDDSTTKAKTRRGRRSGSKTTEATAEVTEKVKKGKKEETSSVIEDAEVIEEVTEVTDQIVSEDNSGAEESSSEETSSESGDKKE